MKKLNTLKSKISIYKTSKLLKISKDMKPEMEQALDEAWNTDDPAINDLHQELFPDGRPTPEEFILAIATLIISESPKNASNSDSAPSTSNSL